MTAKLPAVLCCAALTACGISSGPGFPVSHDLGAAPVRQTSAGSVIVDAPVWLWDERIRYRLLYNDPTIVRYYNLDRWEAPLPALLEHRLARRLKASPVRLLVHLTEFEQQFESATKAYVVLELTVSALAEQDNKLLGKRSFRSSQRSASADAAGAISGFVALIDQAEVEIQNWLETLPGRQRSACGSCLNSTGEPSTIAEIPDLCQ